MSWFSTPTTVPDIPRVMKPRDHSPFDDLALPSLHHPRHPSQPHLPPLDSVRTPDASVRFSPPVLAPDRRGRPIHALPLELLTYVFEIGRQDQIQDAPFKCTQEYLHNVEVIVSQVCRYWRYAALTTPSLWTFIRFHHVSHIDRGREYIHRSGSGLLDIVISASKYEEETRGIVICRDEIDEVFDIVGPLSRRWRSFILELHDAQAKGRARVKVARYGPASELETLEIYHEESSEENSEGFYAEVVHPAAKIFHHNMPKLRNLTLIGVKFQWDVCPEFVFGLEKLELGVHADNVRPTYSQWVKLMQASPNLKSLSLHSSGPRVDNNWPREPLILEALESLSVSHLDSDYLCLLFRHLTLPSVKTLRLELAGQECSYDIFLNTISNSEAPMLPSLSHLHVAALDECSEVAWTAFLICYSSRLTYLELDVRTDLPGEFLTTLLQSYTPEIPSPSQVAVPEGKGKQRAVEPPPPRDELICPRLTTLMTRGVPAALVGHIAASRNEAGRPFERWQIPVIDRPRFDRELEAMSEAERAALQADVKMEFVKVRLTEEELEDDGYLSDELDERSDGQSDDEGEDNGDDDRLGGHSTITYQSSPSASNSTA